MIRQLNKLLLAVGLSLAMSTSTFSENSDQASNQLSALEIVKRSYQTCYYAADNGARKARMLILDKNGNKQIRQFNIFRRDKIDAGDQDFLVVFEKPSDVKDTVFLVNKHIDGDDDRWLYLPDLDLEKRISASDKRTSFVGSDYFYEDISGRNYQLDDYQLTSQDESFYYVKGIPKQPDEVEFVNFEMKIDKTTFMPRAITYFKQGGTKYRKVEILEVKEVEGFPTVFKSKISNFETGGSTLVQFRKPSYNVELEPTLFTERSLRRPPSKIPTK